MTKRDIIRIVSLQTGLKQREIETTLDSIIEVIKIGLYNDDPIELRGFGTFRVIHRKERTGRVIRRFEKIIIPPAYKPVFKPSKMLIKEVNRVWKKRKESVIRTKE